MEAGNGGAWISRIDFHSGQLTELVHRFLMGGCLLLCSISSRTDVRETRLLVQVLSHT